MYSRSRATASMWASFHADGCQRAARACAGPGGRHRPHPEPANPQPLKNLLLSRRARAEAGGVLPSPEEGQGADLICRPPGYATTQVGLGVDQHWLCQDVCEGGLRHGRADGNYPTRRIAEPRVVMDEELVSGNRALSSSPM
jgi:hypothetical protein